MDKKCCIIFPNQLFRESIFIDSDYKFFLIEEDLFFNQYNFHKQKISFHRSSMKFYEDYLVKKGLSFREAHKKSAKLVNIAEKKNLSLNELSFSEIKKIDKLIKPDVIKALKIENSVNSKTSYGGTSIKNVVKMLKKLKKEFK